MTGKAVASVVFQSALIVTRVFPHLDVIVMSIPRLSVPVLCKGETKAAREASPI